MSNLELEIAVDGALSFALRNGGWDWSLDIYGEPLYVIGNKRCGTCQSIFEQVEKQNLSLTPKQLSILLGKRLLVISQDIMDTVAVLLPKGKYVVGLLEVSPLLTRFAEKPWGMSCHANYFWMHCYQESDKGSEYEMLLPIAPESEIDADRVSFYEERIRMGDRPTVLALSVADWRMVRGEFSQWVLAHFVLDGHHKLMAASQLSKPISVLSFLNVSESTTELSNETIRRLDEYVVP